MTAIKIGYARRSTAKQDLETNRQILLELGVSAEQLYLDRAYSGTNRDRPGLDQALAAVRAGDTLVVRKLDRLARSVPDARQIGDSLTARQVRLQLRTMIYDRPTRWASFSSTSWPPSSSRSTCCACALAKAWRSRRPKAGSRAGRRSCRRPARRTF